MNIISEQQTDGACTIRLIKRLPGTYIGEPVSKEV